MTESQIKQAIKNTNLVPNIDIPMHTRAILAGDYTLRQLLDNAGSWYSFDGYAHEDALMDTM
jgi:hypothetical protein